MECQRYRDYYKWPNRHKKALIKSDASRRGTRGKKKKESRGEKRKRKKIRGERGTVAVAVVIARARNSEETKHHRRERNLVRDLRGRRDAIYIEQVGGRGGGGSASRNLSLNCFRNGRADRATEAKLKIVSACTASPRSLPVVARGADTTKKGRRSKKKKKRKSKKKRNNRRK